MSAFIDLGVDTNLIDEDFAKILGLEFLQLNDQILDRVLLKTKPIPVMSSSLEPGLGKTVS